jgi:ubiquinone/menaquinone biosynthesis C-methylase UbiE
METKPNTFQLIAEQLKKPAGEMGKQVAEKMNLGNQLINEWTIEKLNPSANDKILEIGMGNGGFVKGILAVDSSIFYFGCDISELMIEEASRLNKMLIDKKQAEFILATADHLPFQDASFNKVFTVNTIYFWDDPSKDLSEIHRVLENNGKLVISVRPKSIMLTYPFTQYGFKLFSKDDLVELLSANRFRIIDVMEKTEPDQEVNGNIIKVESLIVSAEKS